MTEYTGKSFFSAKLLSFLLVVITFLLPFKPEGLKITIPENIDKASEEFTLLLKNGTNRVLYFEPDIYVEKKTADGWERMEFSEGTGVNEVLIRLVPLCEYRLTVRLSELAQPLSPGEYRLAKPFRGGTAESYTAYSEVFSVT